MSFLFIGFYSNDISAQYCHVDSGYYYHKSHKHRKHYKRNYSNDRKSIIGFRERIDEGIYSGELTRKEERYLKQKLNKLVELENRAYDNGYISRYERRKIEIRKRKLDRKIYEKKHNSRVRN